jgi:hypothetical protein
MRPMSAGPDFHITPSEGPDITGFVTCHRPRAAPSPGGSGRSACGPSRQCAANCAAACCACAQAFPACGSVTMYLGAARAFEMLRRRVLRSTPTTRHRGDSDVLAARISAAACACCLHQAALRASPTYCCIPADESPPVPLRASQAAYSVTVASGHGCDCA